MTGSTRDVAQVPNPEIGGRDSDERDWYLALQILAHCCLEYGRDIRCYFRHVLLGSKLHSESFWLSLLGPSYLCAKLDKMD